jgi:hypothetical protein
MGDDAAGVPIEELVARYRLGDDKALEQILDELSADLAGLVARQRLQAADRDDAGQEAVMAVIRCLGSFDPSRASFRAYAFGTVAKMLRGFKPATGATLDSIPEPSYTHGDLCGVDAESLLQNAPEPEVVRLYFGIGRAAHSINQIAAIVGRSPAAVQAALTESLKWMRARAGV